MRYLSLLLSLQSAPTQPGTLIWCYDWSTDWATGVWFPAVTAIVFSSTKLNMPENYDTYASFPPYTLMPWCLTNHMDYFIFITHLDICHLDSERCVCVAGAETVKLSLLPSQYSVSDIQHCKHVHICSDVKPTVVMATFTDWLITVVILWRKEIYEAFLYIGYVNDTLTIFCLLACALSLIEADDQ